MSTIPSLYNVVNHRTAFYSRRRYDYYYYYNHYCSDSLVQQQVAPSKLFRDSSKKGNKELPHITLYRRTFQSTTATTYNNNSVIDFNKYISKRNSFGKEIDVLAELDAVQKLEHFLDWKCNDNASSTNELLSNIQAPVPPACGYQYEMNQQQINTTIDAALTTFALHIESRIASMLGYGYYTIGPCGEEALSSAGLVFQSQDSVALHYRHLGISLTRQLISGSDNNNEKKLQELIMDRARGYCVSQYDPVTHGVHCSIGTATTDEQRCIGSGDFIVTSTLASQCPPAVGRALGYALASQQRIKHENPDNNSNNNNRPISYVTVGDGSVHNHHFWSAYHLARHSKHKNIKCPVVFGISDNGISISYKTQGYINSVFDGSDLLVPVYKADGNDMMDVYNKTYQAINYSRTRSSPSVLLYTGLLRRFGHAATDRQNAYLTPDDIVRRRNSTLLESMILQAVEVFNVTTYNEIRDRWKEIQSLVLASFATASEETKVTRQDMLDRVAAPLVSIPNHDTNLVHTVQNVHENKSESGGSKKKEVMRKRMTRVITEVMKDDDRVVYLGEDVVHGGYYVVTENIANDFPNRIIDFPPDETSLLGTAMGFAQVGLVPIVEIPYAKYLDCGADMFYEIVISYWLSAGQRPNGMIIRLQGFDRGIFGGNFHTTNTLPHIPPGVDVVCYSNGEDYVRGFRYAIEQAKNGRIIMLVDCTHLLNLRYVYPDRKDIRWERVYPDDKQSIRSFDEVTCYGCHEASSLIVTYGNGVVTAFQARRDLVERGIITSEDDIDIIDCPYLSDVPKGLVQVLAQRQYKRILFADICKEGPGGNILPNFATTLQQQNLLPPVWNIVCAPRTYNPLGSIATFLNKDDIYTAFRNLLQQ